MDEAYQAQHELQKLLVREHGPFAGYKIALTIPAMQQMVGLSNPVVGGIFGKTIHKSPATITHADYIHLGIECEIALQLGSDLHLEMAPFTPCGDTPLGKYAA